MDVSVNLVLGPIVLAVVANAVLYGTCVVQWYTYWTSGFKDPWHTRALIFWVMFLDTFHTFATVWMLWNFTVDNFGNLTVFAHLPWVYPTTPIFIALASMPVQCFLAYRIKILSHSWIVFGTIFVLSLAQGGCGIAGGVLATLLSNAADFKVLIPVATSWLSIAVFTDVLITVILFFYLRRSKTGFSKTDTIIERLIRTAIETAAVGAIFCIVDVIVFTTRGNTNLHYFFALPQGRIYTNTLMLTLNSRSGLREHLHSNNPQSISLAETNRFAAAGATRTEISIAVQQDIRTDGDRVTSSLSDFGEETKVDRDLNVAV